ncbi:hypothetical protein [Nonomuraea guangzhouensis]|uniref:Uncharacterized protein n=1 Tax=Nonomuraea guangzhouensis TaxID=1291555 RepID=A0ABW4GXA8_9ACTN|nr:hypothetical protein [Nonomuraea guangzhouensis]
MSTPDGVLAAIDSCLDDYVVSDDAMRWAPDQPEPTPALSIALSVDFSAFADGLARAAQAFAEGFTKGLAPVLSGMQATFHKRAHVGDRKHFRRCPTCNPRGFPKSLPINGHEYNRRRRRRRNLR